VRHPMPAHPARERSTPATSHVPVLDFDVAAKRGSCDVRSATLAAVTIIVTVPLARQAGMAAFSVFGSSGDDDASGFYQGRCRYGVTSLKDLLSARSYPGPGLAVAKTSQGAPQVVYFLTGRSHASRSRAIGDTA
jgi:hypothetical protein